METTISNYLLTPTALLLTGLGLQMTGILLCWLVFDALAVFDARGERGAHRDAEPVAIRPQPVKVRALVVELSAHQPPVRRRAASAMIVRNAA